jgi:uncharacterized membrane protein YbhN (UPF0104 family)
MRPDRTPSRPGAAPRRFGWTQIRRGLVAAFVLFVIGYAVHWAGSVQWTGVMTALRDYPVGTLASAAAIAIASHLAYSTFDLLGKRWTGHPLGTRRVLAVAFVSYACNINLGPLIGGLAMRLRLYTRLGLSTACIGRVYGLSVLTNWLGYAAVAGAVFVARPLALPPNWEIGRIGLRALGVALLLGVFGYIALCGFARRRQWTLRGHRLTLPSAGQALSQVGLAALNWSLIAAVMYLLLHREVAYLEVLNVLLIAAFAGLVAHIPAGLGVLEAVFLSLLSAQVDRAGMIAALLCYRALYYLAPLLVAATVYLALEWLARAGSPPAVPARPRQRAGPAANLSR